MRVEDIEEGLRRLLAVKSGEAEPTRLERVQLNSPNDWSADDWEFANQRGLVPGDQQVEYQRQVIERRHQAELAALTSTDLPPNFTGNTAAGTVTESPPVVAGGLGATTVGGASLDPEERLRQIELEEERLRVEREALSMGSSAEDAESGYRRMTVPKLQEEISRRNADRSEEDSIEPDSQRKDDLVTALVEDDSLTASRAE